MLVRVNWNDPCWISCSTDRVCPLPFSTRLPLALKLKPVDGLMMSAVRFTDGSPPARQLSSALKSPALQTAQAEGEAATADRPSAIALRRNGGLLPRKCCNFDFRCLNLSGHLIASAAARQRY